jgi:hypothetical protein
MVRRNRRATSRTLRAAGGAARGPPARRPVAGVPGIVSHERRATGRRTSASPRSRSRPLRTRRTGPMRCRRSHSDLTRVCPRRGAAARPNRLRSVPTAPHPCRITVHAHGANASARLGRSARPGRGDQRPRSGPADRDAEAHARGTVVRSDTCAPRPPRRSKRWQNVCRIRSHWSAARTSRPPAGRVLEDLAPSSVGMVRDRGIRYARMPFSRSRCSPRRRRGRQRARSRKPTRTSTWQGYVAAGVRRST